MTERESVSERESLRESESNLQGCTKHTNDDVVVKEPTAKPGNKHKGSAVKVITKPYLTCFI